MTPSERLLIIETFPYMTTAGLEVFYWSSPGGPGEEFWLFSCALLFQCSASCGGGFQKRAVRCVSSEDNQAEDQDLCRCDQETKPLEFQKCNRQACKKNAGE